MNNFRRQAGLTLVEVMISITMGVVFLIAAMTFLLSGKQSSDSQDAGARIQENARFALDIITKSARHAGYSSVIGGAAPAYIYRAQCGVDDINGIDSTNCSDDTNALEGDRIAFAFDSPDGLDCLGVDIDDNDDDGLDATIVNVFWVEESNSTIRNNGNTGTISSLYCQGFNPDVGDWHDGSPQPMVDGVDHMQIEYGLYSNVSTAVSGYLSATEVQALGDQLAIGTPSFDATDIWDNVQSVRFSLVVSSGINSSNADNNASDLDAGIYDNFTVLGQVYAPIDTKIRRVYTKTISFNNFSPNGLVPF